MPLAGLEPAAFASLTVYKHDTLTKLSYRGQSKASVLHIFPEVVQLESSESELFVLQVWKFRITTNRANAQMFISR